MGNMDGEGRLSTFLELTEAQSEQLNTMRTENYKSMKPLKAKMVELRAKERSLLAEESVNLKEVEKSIDQQTDLMNKMRKLQTKHRLEVKDVLTDEQVMKLEQRQRHSARMNQGGKGRGDRPGNRSGFRSGDRSGRGYGRGYGRS